MDDTTVCNKTNEDKDANDTRIVISVEQMIPYLEKLCKLSDDNNVTENDNNIDNDNDNTIYDENELPVMIDDKRLDIDPMFFIMKKRNRVNKEIVDAIIEQKQSEPFDDYTDLNPIIEAISVLQTDELIEGICDAIIFDYISYYVY